MLKVIVYLFLASLLVYFLFYPFLKRSVNRKKVFKWFIIAYGIAALISTAGSYLMTPGQPESFKKGVEIIKKNHEITDQIGVFKSLKYKRNELPEESDNPADLKFKLEGSKGTLLIESQVAKNDTGDWYLMKINKAILIEKY
jgi:hypothetical protein